MAVKKIDDVLRSYFDEDFYRRRYGIKSAAFEHYYTTGWKQGYAPNPLFSTEYYIRHYGIRDEEPLSHYLKNWRSASFVSPIFNISGYLKLYPDVASAGVEPFLHFITHGLEEGRAPGFPLYKLPEHKQNFPAFDWKSAGEKFGVALELIDEAAAALYRQLVDDEHYKIWYGQGLKELSPAEHFAQEGWRYGLWANPFFDAKWYATCHGIGAKDPLWHHIFTGARPVPFFCSKSYINANRDVRSETHAFAHFVQTGAREKRPLGLGPEVVSALRKIELNYAWDQASVCYEFEAQSQEAKISAEQIEMPELPEARREPDGFHLSVFRSKAGCKKLVSFDIWDTILRRNCDPDEVKLYAACILLRALQRIEIGRDATAVELFRLRQLAEYRVADAHYEYTHSAMMREWLSLCGVCPGLEAERLAIDVTEAEISQELAVTWLDPTGLAMLNSLQPEKRRIAISDFYFPEQILRRILAHHGVEHHFHAVYVSCDVMKTKRAGELFNQVLLKEQLGAEDVLHVGDNPRADYEVPLKMGIDAFHFVDKGEEKRKDHMRAQLSSLLAGDGAITAGRMLRTAFSNLFLKTPKIESELGSTLREINKDVLEDIKSVDFLALVFAGFGLFIIEKAITAKVDKVFFATREGVFLRQVYDLLVAHDILGIGDYPDSHILEVSRRATFGASLREISAAEMMRLWSLYSIQSMQALAKSLNLDEDRMKVFCDAFKIPYSDPIELPWEDERVILMLEDTAFSGWVSKEVIRQREALWSYLEHIGFQPGENKTRFMVDIGWRGSIQDNLAFVVNGRVEGVYLALYKYVAEQPINAQKFGYLVDHNRQADTFHVGDFAALEFVANGLGGSVMGYSNAIALRDLYSNEEQIIEEDIVPIQKRILKGIEALIPLLSRAPLTGADWGLVAREAAKRYVERPDQEIAEIFQKLVHNETFGVGEILRIEDDNDARLETLTGAGLHAALTATLSTRRWPQAWLRSKEGERYLNDLSLDRKLMRPRLPGLVRPPAVVRSLGQKISIFAPEPIRGSGGHRTIYNLAKALDKAGYSVDLFSERRGSNYDYKEQELAGSGVRLHEEWYSGIIPDAAIATIQHSAPYLTKYFGKTVRKFYFVQDFEAAFNPVSDGYVRGENSFAEGHTHLCIGRWLTHLLRAQYGCGAVGAGLGVDTDIYRPLKDINRGNRIAVLFQPEKWRRLPEHCLEALIKVKAHRPDTEIVFYGSSVSPNVPFPVVHLGLVDDLHALNRLYNSAAIGLCISLTNPSRIPYEMMAAGCVPVDVYRYNNLFDYEDGTGLLAWQSADSLADAMIHLLQDENELALRRARCIESASCRTLAWETDATVNAIEYVLEGGTLDDLSNPIPSYNDTPFLSSIDQRKNVQAWCDWQRALANFS